MPPLKLPPESYSFCAADDFSVTASPPSPPLLPFLLGVRVRVLAASSSDLHRKKEERDRIIPRFDNSLLHEWITAIGEKAFKFRVAMGSEIVRYGLGT